MTATGSEFLLLIRELIVPEFEKRRFLAVPLAGDDARSPEIRTAFPLGRFRRPHARGFDLVEIQMNRHDADSLRVNFCVVPTGGIDHVAGHVDAEDVWVHYMDHYCTLYRRPFLRSWFSARRLFLKADRERRISTVKEVIEWIPEIDDFFSVGKIGPHVRRV